MALIRYASGRVIPYSLNSGFKTPITNAIAGFGANGGTNCHDAVATGHEEIEDPVLPGAFRAIVFFTDGRPTVIRDVFEIDGEDRDAGIGGYQDPIDRPEAYCAFWDPFQVAEQMNDPNERRRRPYDCPRDGYYDIPDYMPDGTPISTQYIMDEGWIRTVDAAEAARQDGVTVFTIGLGNPNPPDPTYLPDPELLVALANVASADDPLNPGETIVNSYYQPSQTKGEFYFAPDATELEAVFKRVAQEIVVRLTR